jgi:hypothetical protein
LDDGLQGAAAPAGFSGMRQALRRTDPFPRATLVGVGSGALAALIVAARGLFAEAEAARPLAPFVLCLLPAVVGLWIDWARLWRPSARSRFWSGALLGLTALATAEAAALAGGDRAWLALAPLVPLGAAGIVLSGARALLALTRRGSSLFGFGVVRGTVRRDERDRVLLETRGGVVTLDRRAPALGPDRTVDLSIGAPLAVIARLREHAPAADPYRSERRLAARAVLGVAPDVSGLAAAVRRRARAWALYLAVLAAGASAAAAALAHAPAPPCGAEHARARVEPPPVR